MSGRSAVKDALILASTKDYAISASTLGSYSNTATLDKPPLDAKGQKENPNRYGQIVGAHAYTIESATVDYVFLYNPWGVDGAIELFNIHPDPDVPLDEEGEPKWIELDEEERANYNAHALFGEDDGYIRIGWDSFFDWYDDYVINNV